MTIRWQTTYTNLENLFEGKMKISGRSNTKKMEIKMSKRQINRRMKTKFNLRRCSSSPTTAVDNREYVRADHELN